MRDDARRLNIGTERIDYRLAFANRKKLRIVVWPSGRVDVVAPTGTPIARIESVMRSRSRWLLKQLSFFRTREPEPPPRRYVSGETHQYLGRGHLLRLEKGLRPGVRIAGSRLIVTTPDKSPRAVEKTLHRWLRVQAKRLFAERERLCRQRLAHLALPPATLVLRHMRTRWGSCSRGGRITLNPALIKASRGCIDYVITHELLHLKTRHHNDTFFGLLDACMPDWERRRERLNGVSL